MKGAPLPAGGGGGRGNTQFVSAIRSSHTTLTVTLSCFTTVLCTDCPLACDQYSHVVEPHTWLITHVPCAWVPTTTHWVPASQPCMQPRRPTCVKACDGLLLPHLPNLCLGVCCACQHQQAVRVVGTGSVRGGPRHLWQGQTGRQAGTQTADS